MVMRTFNQAYHSPPHFFFVFVLLAVPIGYKPDSPSILVAHK